MGLDNPQSFSGRTWNQKFSADVVKNKIIQNGGDSGRYAGNLQDELSIFLTYKLDLLYVSIILRVFGCVCTCLTNCSKIWVQFYVF